MKLKTIHYQEILVNIISLIMDCFMKLQLDADVNKKQTFPLQEVLHVSFDNSHSWEKISLSGIFEWICEILK